MTDVGEDPDETSLDELGRSLLAATAQGVADPAVYWELAELRLRNLDPQAAVIALDRGLRFAGPEPSLLALRGTTLNELGRYGEALEALSWALALDPDLVSARVGRSVALGSLGRFAESAADSESVLEREPDNLLAMYNRAESLRLLGRYADARAVTEGLLARTPDDADVHRQYTLILQAEGDIGTALDAVAAWLAVDPDDPSPHLVAAVLLTEGGRYDEATLAYDAAIERAPDSVEALLGKAELLDELDMDLDERRNAQLTLVDAALASSPGHTDALRMRALLLSVVGRSAEAVSALERIVDSQGPDSLSLSRLGSANYDVNDFTAAAAVYERAELLYGLDSLEVDALVSYAGALRILNCLDDARRVIGAAIAAYPDSGAAFAESALIHHANAQYDDALASIDRSLELGDRSAFVLGAKADTLNAIERYDEALQLADEALQLGDEALADDSTRQSLHATRGEALRLLDRFDEAVEAFDRALELDPDDRWTRSGRCEAIRQSGHAAEALELAAQLLDEDPDNTFVICTLTAALNDLWRFEEALAAIDPMLEQAPDNAYGWSLKVEALARLDRHTEAHLGVDEYRELVVTDAWGVCRKAQLFQEQGRYLDALTLLDRNERDVRPDAEYRFRQGSALSRLGRQSEAEDRLLQAHALSTRLDIISELADVVALAGDEERALSLRHDALAHLPDDRPPKSWELGTAAWCSFHVGDLDRAIRHYLQATSLDRYVIEWQLELALAEFAAGQRSAATAQIERWRAAVADCPDSTRAAGIVREGRGAFARADQFGLFGRLAPDLRILIEDTFAGEERAHPVAPVEAGKDHT